MNDTTWIPVVVVAIGTLVPGLIHMFGWADTKAGQIVTAVFVDIVGAYKAARSKKSDEAGP